MTAPTLILASSSPRRRELLAKMGVQFEIVAADVEEHMPSTTEDARALAKHNATLKAQAVARMRPGRWVLGSDTIVVSDGRVLGKPPTLEAASEYLAALSGRTHEVVTGCCLIDPDPEERPLEVSDVSRVTFHELSKQTIEKYLAAVHVLDKAGAYALQEHGDWIIERVAGSRDNVLGLPTERLRSVFIRRDLV